MLFNRNGSTSAKTDAISQWLKHRNNYRLKRLLDYIRWVFFSVAFPLCHGSVTYRNIHNAESSLESKKRMMMFGIRIICFHDSSIESIDIFKSLLDSGIQRWSKPCEMVQSLLSGLQEKDMERKMESQGETERFRWSKIRTDIFQHRA